MLLPTKYIPVEKSIVYLGGVILSLFNKSISISELWDKYKARQSCKDEEIVPFDLFIYSVDFLFIINAITHKKGHIYKGGLND